MSTSSKYGFPLPLLGEWGWYCTDLAGRNWNENVTTGLTSPMGWIFFIFLPAFCFLTGSGFAGPSFIGAKPRCLSPLSTFLGLYFWGLEGRSWTKMSICNMVRGSREHSDRQQAHLLMPLPTYKWT